MTSKCFFWIWAIPVRVLAPKLPPNSKYARSQSGPNWATLHTQFVPGGVQGAGPGFPCQNWVLRKWPRGLPHPQHWMDIIFVALWGGSGGWGRGSIFDPNFGREIFKKFQPFSPCINPRTDFCSWFIETIITISINRVASASYWWLLKISAVAAHHGPTPAFQTMTLDRACLGSILKGSRHSGGGQKAWFQGFQKCTICA